MRDDSTVYPLQISVMRKKQPKPKNVPEVVILYKRPQQCIAGKLVLFRVVCSQIHVLCILPRCLPGILVSDVPEEEENTHVVGLLSLVKLVHFSGNCVAEAHRDFMPMRIL